MRSEPFSLCPHASSTSWNSRPGCGRTPPGSCTERLHGPGAASRDDGPPSHEDPRSPAISPETFTRYPSSPMRDLLAETATLTIAPATGGAPLGPRLARAVGDTYELGPMVGRGGMGEVYRAYDRRLRRPVAIKVLLPHLVHSPDMRARFVREAQTAAGLSHPHIVTIYDVGSLDDLVWFVM